MPRSTGVPVGGDYVFAAATPKDRRVALLCVGLLLAQFLAVVPFGHHRSAWVSEFVVFFPVIIAGTVVASIVAAYYFWQEFVLVGRIALLLVGAAYLVRGLIPVVQDLADPGNLPRGSILGTNAGPALWLLGHAAFGVLILIAFSIRQRVKPFRAPLARRLMIVTAVGLPLVLGAVFAATHLLEPLLPELIVPDYSAFTAQFVALGWIDAGLWAAAAVALAISTRFRTMLGMWIGVSLVAVLCENAFMIVFPERPSLGFWMARVDAFLANAIIAITFLVQSTRLHHVVSDQRRWLSSVVDNVADALMTADARGIVTWCNHAAERMLGAGLERIVGSSVTAWFPAYSLGDPASLGQVAETTARREDMIACTVEIARTELLIDGAVMTILIVRDVTSRKQSQEALANARDQAVRAARSKADFLATMSHEIRTPINAIIGMTELLNETLVTPQQHEYASTVHSSAQALRSIIDDVLDVSKLDAGKLALESIPFDPVEVVEAAADIVAGEAHKKGLELIAFVDSSVPRAVWGDPSRLRQVLLNLLGNAVKFTGSGHIVVRALLDATAHQDIVLRFEVEDSGIGIAPEAQARLFMPFEQIDQSTSRRYGGTGLGLSISRRLVELMGGVMGLSSDVGQGSTFWFNARFSRVDGQGADGSRRLDGLRVLVVGGEAAWRDALARTMRAWGVTVEAAVDGAAALTRLETRAQSGHPFDVAILVPQLSDASGVSLGRAIVSDTLFGATRMLLVTGYDGAPPELGADESVFAQFLRKPIRQAVLFEALRGCAPGAGGLAAQSAGVAPADPVRAESESDAALKILLVEDHPVNRQVALRQLQRLGFKADVAMNGREALDATADADYKLVLMDCQMPVMDGFEATRAIRRREAQTGSHVSIVAMTANAMEGDRETCLAAGMDGYLAKPVTLSDLRAVLTRYAAPG